MKKFILIFMLIFASLSLSSCDFFGLEENQVAFYGVAGYIDLGEDSLSSLSIEIPGLGWLVVPKSDSISATVDGVIVNKYEIEAGDLVKVWFRKADNVEILESFPAQFGKEPDSIFVTKHNVALKQNEDASWVFEFDFDDVAYETDFNILDKTTGDELQIWYSIIEDSIPTHTYSFTSVIEILPDERISITISNDLILNFLMYYHDDNIVLFDDITTT